MSPLWVCLFALGAASLVPENVRAASLDSFSFQRLSVEEKAEAVRNAVSLLSVKAALLAARSAKEAAIQNAQEAEEAPIMYREEESNLEGTFLKAIDCQLGLEPPRMCEVERHTVSHREGEAPEALPETPSPTTAPTTASTEAARPASGDTGSDLRGSRGVSLDLKASWTVSALQNGGENLLNDAELLTYLGKKAGGVARDFFKAAAGGHLLEPTSRVPAEVFDEEKLGEVVRLAGKILGSLQLNLTPTSLTLDAETRAGAVRRLTTKEKEAVVGVHRDCKHKKYKVKKCVQDAKTKSCSESKGKACSEFKDKCSAELKGKCNSGAKKKCGKYSSLTSEESSNVVQPAPIASAALPFYSPYPVVLQPQMISLPAHTPGVPITYGLSTVGTAANAAGAATAPFYRDGYLLYPVAQGVAGGVYQLNADGINQGGGPFTTSGVSEGVYLLSDTGSAPAWRSNEFLPRLPIPGRNSILQEISPLILGPIAAINAQVQQNPLLSPLYRSAFGRYLFDAEDATHYEELRNFNMTREDLF